MTLSEYIKHLQKLEDDYGDLKVIYSKDDEGNEYQDIEFRPSLGFIDFDEGRYGRYEYCDFNLEDDEDIEFIPNVVCVN